MHITHALVRTMISSKKDYACAQWLSLHRLWTANNTPFLQAPETTMFKGVLLFAQWSKVMLRTGLLVHIPHENRVWIFQHSSIQMKDNAKHLRISGAILFQQIAKPDKIQVVPPPYPSANMRLVMTLAHHHSMRWGLTPNKIPTNGQNWH